MYMLTCTLEYLWEITHAMVSAEPDSTGNQGIRAAFPAYPVEPGSALCGVWFRSRGRFQGYPVEPGSTYKYKKQLSSK